MADIASFAAAEYCAEIVQHCCWIAHELREARIGRTDEPPQKPHRDEPGGGVPGPVVDVLGGM
eukprot:TRINITY_DN33018_c0_g1_i1.p3 TRINITY_DN33018_c0_g1~~TRINITY_DN33018_c0_g1_i1.p3  ORF type:complete len:63 (-),score=0.89 TRINITY_DN33018_c0_g1_i1:161-349(-)